MDHMEQNSIIAKPVSIKATNVCIYHPEDNDYPIFIQDVETGEPRPRELHNNDCCNCCNCCECCNTELCKYIKSFITLIIVTISVIILLTSIILGQTIK